MTTPERKGSLIKWFAECGHWMVCYSLEPTPTQCPDCADSSLKILKDMVGWGDIDLDEVPSDIDGELNEWMDESGVTDVAIREDIRKFVQLVDDARGTLDHASFEGRRMVDKYESAERLTLPEATG